MAACAGVLAPLLAPAKVYAAPAPLSADHARVAIDSSDGSGSFGRWRVDASGLPDYSYTLDERTAPQAAQPELAGARTAWHQIGGGGEVIADAFNDGYVQLWSQDRVYQWMNFYDASSRHYAGGYGYVDLAGHSYSTLYPDRSRGETIKRTFGLGYARTVATVPGLQINALVYAPYGNAPLLLHDVTLTNTSRHSERPTWFEYWDVNPAPPSDGAHRGTSAPVWDAKTQTLSVAQLPNAQDTAPLSIFAAALAAPVAGYDTDTQSFFGRGSRAAPAAVAANASRDSIAPPSLGPTAGQTMFAFRSPVALAAGASVTLRYAYGYDHRARVGPLVARFRRDADAFAKTERAWSGYVPQVSLGHSYVWLSRELQWDAYMLKSDESYEDCAGEHLLSQAGYYQYALGIQAAFRDPLQLMLPAIYTDPRLARSVMLYSAEEQSSGADAIPYGRTSSCTRLNLGTSDDLDLWLLMSAEEYGLATRDFAFFDKPVRWANGGSGTLWAHLQLAFAHQESQHGPHGDYLSGTNGDWSDLSTAELQMTESSLVTAQAAYIYPRLAELATLRRHQSFARELEGAGAKNLRTLRGEWTGRGWYGRGWSGARQLGSGAIFEEPQPFAILAGAPSPARAIKLVANIRRFLTGVGAPGGPSRIGSAQSPAADDPLVTEHSTPPGTEGNAVFVGGVWYSLNGWLTWALGTLDGEVPHARADALSELVGNTLDAHADAYPDSWDGILSVDDTCHAWYSRNPAQCGNGLTTAYDTQIPHQDAWSLWDLIELAGISSQRDGFRIVPHLPMANFSVRLADAGVASAPGLMRGYIRPLASGTLQMLVAPPSGSDAAHVTAYANGHRVPSHARRGLVSFSLRTVAGRAADWAITGA